MLALATVNVYRGTIATALRERLGSVELRLQPPHARLHPQRRFHAGPGGAHDPAESPGLPARLTGRRRAGAARSAAPRRWEMRPHLLTEPALRLVEHDPVQARPRPGLAGLPRPLAELRVGRLLADAGQGPAGGLCAA